MTPTSNDLQARWDAVCARIAAAARMAGRDPASVGLLAVSKLHPAEAVVALADLGQHAFGENYVQEGVAKMTAAGRPLEWHFIGPLQSNKTRQVAEHFAWVHSVERLKIAERLSAQRPEALPALSVCLQVNVSGEASKSGCAPEDVPALARAVAALPRLRLRGLMCIPEPSEDRGLLRSRFAGLRTLQQQLRAEGMPLDTLSMGMSDDLEEAVAEGATLLRIGSALFGPRPARPGALA